MESITLGQVALVLTFLVALITAVKYLLTEAKTWISDSMKSQMDTFAKKIDTLEEKISEVDMQTCKNYLTTRLAEIEMGRQPTEVEKERIKEQYDHYTHIGGNSYIKDKYDQLKADGKL